MDPFHNWKRKIALVLSFILANCAFAFVPSSQRCIKHHILKYPLNLDTGIPSSSSCLYALDPNILLPTATIAALGGGALWLSGSEDREKKEKYAVWEAENQKLLEEREKLAFVETRETWTVDDIAPYNGSTDEYGPILFAADGEVYNVWKGRHFYGPGCEYHIFAGRDATRLLAKSKLEEETEEEKRKPLTVAEKAALQGWIYTFKNKYEIVGKLEGFDPSTTKF